MTINKKPAFEAIAFQDSAFFAEMTQAVQALRAALRQEMCDEVSQVRESQRVCDVIKQHTNLSVFIAREAYTDAGIMMPRLINGHIFDTVFEWTDASSHEYEFNEDMPKLLRKYKDGFSRGMVDISKNRVEGIFAEIPYKLHLSAEWCRGLVYLDEELAAIILHEVGHAFTQCEYMDRSVATNQVLADIAMARTSGNPDKVNGVIAHVAHEYQLTDEQKRAFQAAKKDSDYAVLAYAAADENCRRELGYSVYESTSCEQLADMYAARCGAGRYIVTGLDKMYRHYYGGYDESTKATAFTRAAFSMAFVVASVSAYLLIFAPIAAAVGAVVSAIGMPLLLMKGASAAVKYAEYDDHYARSKRLRNQVVELLKSPHIKPKLVKAALQDLKEIDKVLDYQEKLLPEQDKNPIGHRLGVLFSSVYRKRVNSGKLQQELEALAGNELFVQAAKLKTL